MRHWPLLIKTRMNNENKYTGLEIAIIGIGCRFPGANNWRDYWTNLVNGVESVHFMSKEELEELGIAPSTAQDPRFVNIKTAMINKDCFDSYFFDYRPDEARLMSPVHRIYHECVWEALEDAGCN